MGADAEEDFNATPSDPQNRFQPVGGRRPIRSWTPLRLPSPRRRFFRHVVAWVAFRCRR